MINLDDFKKINIRIGKVISAEKIPEGDRLLKLIFDFGNEERQVMSAIAEYFEDPSVLVGVEMPVVMNLEPRKFKGYESQGMIVAVSDGDIPVLLKPEREVPPGSIVV